MSATANTYILKCKITREVGIDTENRDRVAISATKTQLPIWTNSILSLEQSPKIVVLETPTYNIIMGSYHEYVLDNILA